MILELNRSQNELYTIAVIIPTYNRKELLKKAILSVLNQSFKSKEIIVVDDCSNFNTKEYLDKFFSKEILTGLIKVIVNNKNFGAAKSRNVGIKNSRSNYIAFLDSDDCWHLDKLKKQIKKFEENRKLDLVYCDQYVIKDGVKNKSGIKMINKNILNYLINFWLPTSPSALLFKKKSLEDVGCFDEEIGRSASDHYLWFRMAIKKFNVDFVDEPLCYYYTENQDRNSLNLNNRMTSIKVLLRKVQKHISKEKFLLFESLYIGTVCSFIFKEEMKNKNYFKMIQVYFKFLIFNKYFYKTAIRNLLKIRS